MVFIHDEERGSVRREDGAVARRSVDSAHEPPIHSDVSSLYP